LIAFASIAAAAIENGSPERIRQELIVRSNFERYFARACGADRDVAGCGEAGRDKRPVAVCVQRQKFAGLRRCRND